jgi:hypothetical protein
LVIFFLTLLINQYLGREGEKKKKKETQRKAREAWSMGDGVLISLDRTSMHKYSPVVKSRHDNMFT